MNNLTKFPIALCALLSASSMVQTAQAGIWFDDSFIRLDNSFFLDEDWVNEIMNLHQRSMENMKLQIAEFGPSKEDQEAIKAAREKMGKIKPELKEDDQKITISLSGFEKLDKEQVKIEKENYGWHGIITTSEGNVELFITSRGFRIDRDVEVKKDEKESKDKDSKDAAKGTRVYYSRSLASEGQNFKQFVDMRKVKAEAIKNNTLTITIEKEKKEVLQIPS